jgi:arsenite/tail-anchored protein-transporting ATPase
VRTLLFTGPGGAGTTTMAASAAVRAARAGRRTVLLSRQDVPGLGDVPRLEVVRVDQQAALERFWGGLAEGLGPVLPQLSLPPSSSVVPLPGGADLALFAELAGADADLVVLDAGPVEAAAAFVALPATLRWWLDQLFPPGLRALGAVRTAAVGSGALRRGPVDAALAAIPVLEGLLAADRLAVRADTAVCLVALPTSAAVDRLRTAVTTLALHGLRPAAVLTRVPPSEGTGAWATARAADRDAALAAFAELAEVRQVPEGAVGPVDADGLAELLEGFAPGPGAKPAAPGPERRDGAWQLSLPLPFAHRGDVTLTRWMDDLVVTVGGARRCLALDPLLRRCEVTGGRLVDPGGTDARLEVGFRPDPQQWPADLLAADERTP